MELIDKYLLVLEEIKIKKKELEELNKKLEKLGKKIINQN